MIDINDICQNLLQDIHDLIYHTQSFIFSCLDITRVPTAYRPKKLYPQGRAVHASHLCSLTLLRTHQFQLQLSSHQQKDHFILFIQEGCNDI